MNASKNPINGKPPILYGAYVLAGLSLIWSGYAISDLMHSGKFGLSVAVAGDVGWITVLWAEARGLSIAGRAWAATVAGWLIAIGVALLLVIHGNETGGKAQAIAGPFVVLVGKIVWAFALEAMKDPTAPTSEMRAELNTVLRNSAHQSAMLHARTESVINRIQAESEVTLARDEADFQIGRKRQEKHAELQRLTPLSLTAGAAEQPVEVKPDQVAIPADQFRDLIAILGDQARDRADDHDANKQVNPANTDRDPVASIADLAREQVAITRDNSEAVDAILALRPDASKPSVAAAVRRARKAAQGPYL